MPAKQSEELIDEAHGNLNEDRSSIKEFTALLEKAAKVGEDLDPMAKIAMAESFARLTGELTKNNSLLIELAKLRAKKEFATSSKGDGFNEDEADSMFDEIEDPDVKKEKKDEDEDEDDGSN
jgi:hypothetical protein